MYETNYTTKAITNPTTSRKTDLLAYALSVGTENDRANGRTPVSVYGAGLAQVENQSRTLGAKIKSPDM